MAIPEESHFIAPARKTFLRGPFSATSFVDYVLGHERVLRWGLPHDVVREAFERSPPASYADAVRLLFQTYATSLSKARYGDKTPRYVLHIRELATLLPEARIIHVIRDGRDVALSNLDSTVGPDSVVEAALGWRRTVDKGRRAGARLGPSRYIEVRYEDLIEDPERELKRLCSFADLAFDQDMLRYFESGDRFVDADHHQHLRKPPVKGLRDWKRDMPKDDVVVFEIVAGSMLQELGYEHSQSPRTLPHHISARAREMRAHAQRIRRRLDTTGRYLGE